MHLNMLHRSTFLRKMQTLGVGSGQCFYHSWQHCSFLNLRHALPRTSHIVASVLHATLQDSSSITASHRSADIGSKPLCATAWQRRGVQTRVVNWKDAVSQGDPERESEHLNFEADLTKKDKQEEKKAKARRRATNSAAGLVSWRPRSEQELRQKLAEKEHEPEAIDAAVERVQELGMQSDQEFAELFAQSKWRQARWAPSRIRRELRMKGLGAEAIDRAIKEVFGDDMRIHLPDPDEDPEDVSADTRFDPRYHLIEGARRQAELSRGLPVATRKRRLIMWLQRRGHNWDTIQQLLEHVDLA